MNSKEKVFSLPVLVGAFGYFVDIFDLVLFGMVRISSLKGLGLEGGELLSKGILLLNSQMAGLLFGGFFWGILGDKKGRMRVLFGSIFLYSIANVLNAFVTSIELYALLRFIAGVGLAGELGAAITLVSEVVSKENRGYATTIVTAIGLSGAVVAGLTTGLVPWRMAYVIGGLLGLSLLFLRIRVRESPLFLSICSPTITRGNVLSLFRSKEIAVRYFSCIAVGIPIWFVGGIMMTFSPEFGKYLGIDGPIVASKAIMYSYAGMVIGDLVTGFLSQKLRSRKKAVLIALLFESMSVGVILTSQGWSTGTYYFWCGILGFTTGFWAVFVTLGAEQFGTNLRATATTSIPNLVRGSVIPMTLLFNSLIERFGFIQSAWIVALLCGCTGFLGIFLLKESYDRDLNFIEPIR